MYYLLSSAVTVDTLDEMNRVSAISGGTDLNSQNTILLVMVGAIVLIIAGILILPKFFDKVLNLGPILGIVALVGAAIALPYSVYLAVNPTSSSTSADLGQTVSNIKFEASNNILAISWETSIPSLGSIKYGTNPDNLDQVAFTEDPIKKKLSHQAIISDLDPNAKYYFEIVVGKNRYRQAGKPLEFVMPK